MSRSDRSEGRTAEERELARLERARKRALREGLPDPGPPALPADGGLAVEGLGEDPFAELVPPAPAEELPPPGELEGLEPAAQDPSTQGDPLADAPHVPHEAHPAADEPLGTGDMLEPPPHAAHPAGAEELALPVAEADPGDLASGGAHAHPPDLSAPSTAAYAAAAGAGAQGDPLSAPPEPARREEHPPAEEPVGQGDPLSGPLAPPQEPAPQEPAPQEPAPQEPVPLEPEPALPLTEEHGPGAARPVEEEPLGRGEALAGAADAAAFVAASEEPFAEVPLVPHAAPEEDPYGVEEPHPFAEEPLGHGDALEDHAAQEDEDPGRLPPAPAEAAAALAARRSRESALVSGGRSRSRGGRATAAGAGGAGGGGRGPGGEHGHRHWGARTIALIAIALVAVAVVIVLLVSHSSGGSGASKASTPATIRVLIPEGATRLQIAEMASKAGLAGSYREASRTSPILDPAHYGAPASTHTLEGFLFPATYDEYPHAPVSRLVSDQLTAFQEHFGTSQIAAAKTLHVTPYGLLTVASMVEREAAVPSDRAKIAAVIYNRLKAGMPLGIDATTYYAIELERNVPYYTKELTEADLHMSSAYNTRIHTGLPPTPIANPGAASIEAAAHPASVSYLYYVAGADGCGEQVFSNTSAEFETNVAAYEAAVKANGGKPPKCKK